VFIELTEVLKCPRDHPESYLVCVPAEMDGRSVVRGGLGCPACGAEYAILDGVAYFGPRAEPPRAEPPGALTAEALASFVALEGSGGYALLVGSVARLLPELAAGVPLVHWVGVNPPRGSARGAGFSLLVSPRALPVKTGSVRAVGIGADHALAPWLEDGARTLLEGLRFVAETGGQPPPGIEPLARAAGVVVGEKRGRSRPPRRG
jgi:uncharacterized protein YbaR (Trm112 family)